MNSIPPEYRGKPGRARLLHALKSQKLVQNDETIAQKLLAVAKPMTFVAREDKDHIITEAERKYDIYFILSGNASVRIKRHEVAIRGPGDHVGEMALIDPVHPRSASVIATERTTVAMVGKEWGIHFSNITGTAFAASEVGDMEFFAREMKSHSSKSRQR